MQRREFGLSLCEDRGHEEQTSETLQTLGLRHPTSDFARRIYYFLYKGRESEGGEWQSGSERSQPPADYGKGKGNGAAMNAAKGVLLDSPA